MAELHRLNTKKQADRRAALVALHAMGRGKGSDCLTEEQLACLVDGQCTSAERESFLDHLADCPACRRTWLELFDVVHDEKNTGRKKTGTVHTFLRPNSRRLAWAGSLLAAAASVVLFLNISRNVPSPVLHQQMESGTKAGKVRMPSKSMDHNTTVESRFDQTVMESAPSAGREAADMPEPEAAPRALRKAARAPARKKMRAEQQATVGTDSILGEITVSPAPAPETLLSDWLRLVEHGCRKAEPQASFWAARVSESQEVLNSVGLQERQYIQILLPLLKELQQKPEKRKSVCLQIKEQVDKMHMNEF